MTESLLKMVSNNQPTNTYNALPTVLSFLPHQLDVVTTCETRQCLCTNYFWYVWNGRMLCLLRRKGCCSMTLYHVIDVWYKWNFWCMQFLNIVKWLIVAWTIFNKEFVCWLLSLNYINITFQSPFILSQNVMLILFDASTADDFRKCCDRRSNANRISNFTFCHNDSMIILSFIKIFHIFV